jgi:hypothetical protein
MKCRYVSGKCMHFMTTNNHLDEAARQLREELAAQREAEAELEALRSSTARVPDLVLGDV